MADPYSFTGGDDGGLVSPAYDANGGSTYTWGPADPATPDAIDDSQPPPGQLSFDPTATLAAAQDLASEPEPFNPEREPRSEQGPIGVMDGVAPGGFGIPGASFGEGETQDGATEDGGFYSPDAGTWTADGGDLTGGFWTTDPSGSGGPSTAGPDGGAYSDGYGSANGDGGGLAGTADYTSPPVYSFDDGSTITYGDVPVSTDATGDASSVPDPADQVIRDMSPEPPDRSQPPEIDTAGVIPYAMSEADAARQQLDLTINYRDGASPHEVFQGSGPGGPGLQAIGNCTTVAGTNAILADPNGPAYIASLMTTNPDGSVTFALPGGNQTVWPGHDQFAWSPLGPNDPAVLFTTAMAYQLGQVPTHVDSNPAVLEDALDGRTGAEFMEAAGLVNITSADGRGAPGPIQIVDGPIPGVPGSSHSYYPVNGFDLNPFGTGHGLVTVEHSYGGELPPVGPTGGGSADFGALNEEVPPDLP